MIIYSYSVDQRCRLDTRGSPGQIQYVVFKQSIEVLVHIL